MMKAIDNFLDRITMYRLVLYGLIGLVIIAMLFGFFDMLPYSPGAILFSASFLLFVSLITNGIFARVFEAPTNIESAYITALILALIVTPFQGAQDLPMLFWAAVLAMASKYILAINRKHIFNPVAIAVALTALWLNDSASWWIGTTTMMPFVVVLGLLIVRKIRHEAMVISFFIVAFLTQEIFTLTQGGNIIATIQTLILHSSLLFFAFIMLTEPFTTPPTKELRIFYGGIVGFLFSPLIHLGSFYWSPELALVTGNIFSYLVSPKLKLYLHAQEKVHYGEDIIDFIFAPTTSRTNFAPGQYMEWTLPHQDTDSRGNRRYFTVASSPTEDSIHLGIKFYPQGSSFKKALIAMDEKTPIVAGNVAGDFTLPNDPKTKLVFIAGGIGVTPFRSMIKYCIDKKEERPIVLFYANKVISEFAYTDIFEQAEKIGIKTVYALTDTHSVPKDWHGKVGRITSEMIKEEVPDFMERFFYLSGPHPMVTGYEETLREMGVPLTHIKKDFFPGYV
ncbi:MAG TPA: hypothetical protein VND99_06285 [Candidatus Acidoferrales bacterium]|nr:hypothetical protein [Candidatus Acidoferrales bacterium]